MNALFLCTADAIWFAVSLPKSTPRATAVGESFQGTNGLYERKTVSGVSLPGLGSRLCTSRLSALEYPEQTIAKAHLFV